MSKILLVESKSSNYEQIQTLEGFINEASSNGYQLLMNLLEWSRLQAGGIKIELERHLLHGLVNEVVKLMIPA